MPNIYYTEALRFNEFIDALQKDFRVFAPLKKDNSESGEVDYSYTHLSGKYHGSFNPYRAIEPLKSFLTAPRQRISHYFNPGSKIQDSPAPSVILGAKNCDLTSLKIQDFVFLEGVEVDYFYRLSRQNTVLISSDCSVYKKVCFCMALDVLPYAVSGFDLNLSPLTNGYLVESGSQKGEELIAKYRSYFNPAKETQIKGRQTKRENFMQDFKKYLLAQNIPPKDTLQKLVRQGYNLQTWQQFMLSCVECGGCNLICNTCHCFLLADSKTAHQNNRLKIWDSCQYENFSRVAGGANPLKTRTKRLRNRFMKKFDFFVDNIGMPACCGCGRCIEVCPGKIDLREVLKDLAARLALKA